MKFEIDDLEFKSLYSAVESQFKKDLNLQINSANRFSVQHMYFLNEITLDLLQRNCDFLNQDLPVHSSYTFGTT